MIASVIVGLLALVGVFFSVRQNGRQSVAAENTRHMNTLEADEKRHAQAQEAEHRARTEAARSDCYLKLAQHRLKIETVLQELDGSLALVQEPDPAAPTGSENSPAAVASSARTKLCLHARAVSALLPEAALFATPVALGASQALSNLALQLDESVGMHLTAPDRRTLRRALEAVSSTRAAGDHLISAMRADIGTDRIS